MLKKMLMTFAMAALIAPGAFAQDAQQAQEAKEKTPQAKSEEKPAPRPPDYGARVNVNIELTITEQVGTGTPAKKLVTLTVADRQSSFVRSRGDVRVGSSFRSVNVNVDARPTILREGVVLLDFGLEYQPQPNAPSPTSEPTSLWSISERSGVILESGKPMLISQAFDPTTDRRLTVEIKATILK